MSVNPVISVNETNRSPLEADVLSSYQSSQSRPRLLPQGLKNMLNSFFLNLSTDNFPPYLETVDPFQQTQNRIRKNCCRFYFQVLQEHYCSSYFLSEQQLQEAHKEALRLAMENCESLIFASTNFPTADNKKRVCEEIRESLQIIGFSVKNKNAERRMEFCSSQKSSIYERFQQMLKSRYNFEISRKIPPKFYNHEKLIEFVNNAVECYHAKCESFIQLLTPMPQQLTMNCQEGADGQLREHFESLKSDISIYGSDLIDKNGSNKQLAEQKLDEIVYEVFEAQCREFFKDKAFLNKTNMLEDIKEEKQKCLQQIITVCDKRAVEDATELQAKYEKKLELREKNVARNIQKCVEDVGKNRLNCYGDKIDSKLQDVLASLQCEARRSKVMDCHVEIYKNNFLKAIENAKAACHQMLIFDENADQFSSTEEASNQNGESNSSDDEMVDVSDGVGCGTPAPTSQLTITQGNQVFGQGFFSVRPSPQVRGEQEYDSDSTGITHKKNKRGWSNGSSCSKSSRTLDGKRGRKQ